MPPNILLIVVDALRYDRVGGSNRDVHTPSLDELYRDGASFTNTISNSNVTDVCVTSILTGQYPLEHGVLHHGTHTTQREQRQGHSATSLAERFGSEGYYTAAVEPVLGRWHRDGFDRYVEGPESDDTGGSDALDVMPDWAISAGGKALEFLPDSIQSSVRESVLDRVVEITDGDGVNRAAIDLLEETDDDPFFCFLHYWDVHTPYDPPERYVESVRDRNEYDDTPVRTVIDEHGFDGTITGEALRKRKLRGELPETIGDIEAHYDAAVEYVDDCIDELLTSLSDRGILEDTCVVLTADHGESLVEKGVFFDHHGLHDPVVNVPLVVSGPHVPDTSVFHTVQHVDIAPTVCDIAGLDEPQGAGESLVPLIRGTTDSPPRDGIAFAEERHTRAARMMYDDDVKLITTLKGDGECRYCELRHEAHDALYDLGDDPDETVNLLDDLDTDPRAQSLLDAFETFEESLVDPSTRRDDGEYDEDELQSRLEHLGYQ